MHLNHQEVVVVSFHNRLGDGSPRAQRLALPPLSFSRNRVFKSSSELIATEMYPRYHISEPSRRLAATICRPFDSSTNSWPSALPLHFVNPRAALPHRCSLRSFLVHVNDVSNGNFFVSFYWHRSPAQQQIRLPRHVIVIHFEQQCHRLRRQLDRASRNQERLHNVFFQNIGNETLAVSL
jgi:hypothetical protein